MIDAQRSVWPFRMNLWRYKHSLWDPVMTLPIHFYVSVFSFCKWTFRWSCHCNRFLQAYGKRHVLEDSLFSRFYFLFDFSCVYVCVCLFARWDAWKNAAYRQNPQITAELKQYIATCEIIRLYNVVTGSANFVLILHHVVAANGGYHKSLFSFCNMFVHFFFFLLLTSAIC